NTRYLHSFPTRLSSDLIVPNKGLDSLSYTLLTSSPVGRSGLPPSSSVTRTIRIERDVDDFLRKFGEREGVSVNLLVNKAIRRLVDRKSTRLNSSHGSIS